MYRYIILSVLQRLLARLKSQGHLHRVQLVFINTVHYANSLFTDAIRLKWM